MADDKSAGCHLLEELLDAPTEVAGSHLDIILDIVAGSPAIAPSLGRLGCCSRVMKQQVCERLQKHKEVVATKLQHDVESTPWGRECLAATTRLHLVSEDMGDEEAFLLSRWICVSGALAQLQVLGLSGNKIGDPGVTALVQTFASGALAHLRKLYLNDNQIGDAGVEALAKAAASGALAQLQKLWIHQNQIGDAGVTALANACANGALAKLENVYLGGNPGNRELVEKVLRERKK